MLLGHFDLALRFDAGSPGADKLLVVTPVGLRRPGNLAQARRVLGDCLPDHSSNVSGSSSAGVVVTTSPFARA